MHKCYTMPSESGTRHGLEICPSPDVLAWLEEPRAQRDEAEKVRTRIKFVFNRIEDAGRLSGAKYLEQINLDLDPPLLEVKINWSNLAFRLFGVCVGNRLCLSEVRQKKKQALSSAEYRALHARAKAFADSECLKQC